MDNSSRLIHDLLHRFVILEAFYLLSKITLDIDNIEYRGPIDYWTDCII